MDGYDCEPTDYEKVEALQRRVAELEAVLHWLLSLFHARRDATGWRVVMHEYPPSPEDCERIGELAARYGVDVSVAQNDAPTNEAAIAAINGASHEGSTK